MYNHIDRVIKFALQYSTYPPAYPIEIGEIILRIYPEKNLLTSAILYSTIDYSSHKNISKGLQQIKDCFGPHTAYKIGNITEFSNYEYIAHDLTQIYKFTSALKLVDKTTNSSILLIKLARLLHSLSVFNNYYTLSHEQIKLVSLDILEIYLPLISGVDIEDVKIELQEFCTKILYPDINKDIKKYLGVIESSEEFINDVIEDLNKELSNSQIKAKVSGRIKSYYSIWRKLHYKNTTIEKINDIIGLRIIVDNIDDCYSALKVVHHRYQSLPKKFHDFINIPKGNGYKSLHTVIVGPKSQKLEVQIRTTEMHQVAQYGSAAHWEYKHDFTKILSVFIAAQKLYTKPTVNLTNSNSVTQNSKVNTYTALTNIQQNAIVIHMSSIGLLAVDKNTQSTDDKVATDENQYITSQQKEYTDSGITIQPLVYGFMNLLFKFVQDNVYDQIMIFIVENDIANSVNITVEAKEVIAQEFWDDMSYVNSKHVSACSKKDMVIICSKYSVYSNFLQMLVETNSVVTENIDTAKTNTLTNIESNYNKLHSEQITQEEKQEINSIQNTFSAILSVSNISDNTINITNAYEPELQNEGIKFTNDVVQYFQLPFNTTTLGEEKENNTYSEYSSASDGDDESEVALDSKNRTTNFENKTPRTDTSLLRNDTVDNIDDNHEYTTATHIQNKGTNSNNMISQNIITLHRYAAKMFCAIIKSEVVRSKLREIVEDCLYKCPSLKKWKADQNSCKEESLKQIHNILNLYESICPQNIDLIFENVETIYVKNTEENNSTLNNVIRYNISQGPQPQTGTAINRYFADMLDSNASCEVETFYNIQLSTYIYGVYNLVYKDHKLRHSDLRKNIIDRIDNLNSVYDIENSRKSEDSKGIMECVENDNLAKLYKILRYSPTLEDILNTKDNDGNTPILLAIRKGNFLMTMLLLFLGDSNLNVENNDQQTPLSLAFTSRGTNKCIINLLMHKMIIKDEKLFSINRERFQEFITQSKEFEQFYNACRSYVAKFSSIMIIDLLVEMSIVSPELMKNLVVGLYCKSYIKEDGEFREYFKYIGSVDTGVIEEDCEMMIYNYYNTIIEPQFKKKSAVLERDGILSIENIGKILKCYYILLQSEKQLQIIGQMLSPDSQHSKVKNDKKGIRNIYYPSTTDGDVIKKGHMICKNGETQEGEMTNSKSLSEYLRRIYNGVVKRPTQQYKHSSDEYESTTSDTNNLKSLYKEILKVRCLAKDFIVFLINNDKNMPTDSSMKKCEKTFKTIYESIHEVEKLFKDVYTFTTLRQKDLHLLDSNALPTPSDTKILPEHSIIKFLRKVINGEDRESIIKEVRETMANDVEDVQQMDDILLHLAHEIKPKDTDADIDTDITLTGEQHDLE